MKTFTELKDFVANPHYQQRRRENLVKLDINTIDTPIIDIINGLSRLPYCFTLQSCYGHFLYKNQENPTNTEPLPLTADITRVKYRIAYIALCIENSAPGRALFQDLGTIPQIDREYIQFGCADWFWQGQVNTYALQVEPERHKNKDWVYVDYQEALHIESTRNKFFTAIRDLLRKHPG